MKIVTLNGKDYRFYSAQEAADMIGMDKRGIIANIKKGRLKAIKLGGNVLMIEEGNLKKYLTINDTEE